MLDAQLFLRPQPAPTHENCFSAMRAYLTFKTSGNSRCHGNHRMFRHSRNVYCNESWCSILRPNKTYFWLCGGTSEAPDAVKHPAPECHCFDLKVSTFICTLWWAWTSTGRGLQAAHTSPPPTLPQLSWRAVKNTTCLSVCHNTLVRMCILADSQRDILNTYLQFLCGHYEYAGASRFTALNHTLQPIHMPYVQGRLACVSRDRRLPCSHLLRQFPLKGWAKHLVTCLT